MRTNPYEFRTDGRPTDQAREAVGDLRVAEIQVGPTSPRGVAYGWTPAHSEAFRFLGECFAVGAVLGLVTEMARPMRGKRYG
jgi:hypothetical protein